MKEATDAVNKLTGSDIAEAKGTQSPSSTAKSVFISVYILLEKQPKFEKIEWKDCQKMMAANFFANLKSYDRDNVEPKVLKGLEKFLKASPDMEDSSLKVAGKVALSLGKWSKAVLNYA